jgi:hypothetical protein
VYVSLYDIGLLILFTLALAVGYYLIAALRGLLRVTTQVSEVISENQQSIESVLSALPELLTNSNEVVMGVRKTVDATNSAVTCLEDNLTDTADRVQETMETALMYARCAGEVAKAVVGVFTKTNDK